VQESKLLGPNGSPIKSSNKFKKAPPPKLGEAFGHWAGRDVQYANLPGGGIVQFDLNQLKLEDYRMMKDHYQINASLSVLSFIQHQADWHIECEDAKIRDLCEEQLRQVWTPLNRSLGQANWAGYSPNALNWENDIQSRSVKLDKIKDLIPEECAVHWKDVPGWAPPGRIPPKFKVYDGIDQIGQPWPIPTENSFWYPLLMENGDYYGKKLLRAAFTPWYFSVLVHLFANRYYERFGEPVPIGRAPFDEEVDGLDTGQTGREWMLDALSSLRSRSAVVLPNTRTPTGTGNESEWDYEIEYLESQMRGADFERYLTRLDEEMSLGVFTPILLMRTADVGSYNLGVGHMQVWLWMLNALNGDRKQYIDKYILRPIKNFNFSEKAPEPRIVFKKLGDQNADMIRSMITELIRADKVKPDLTELGEMAGLTLKEVRALTDDPANDAAPDPDNRDTRDRATSDGPKGTDSPRETQQDVAARVRPQIENAFRANTFGPGFKVSLGYKRKFEESFRQAGVRDYVAATDRMYSELEHIMGDLSCVKFSGPNEVMSVFSRHLNSRVEEIMNGR
jgi:hypothetical protein